MSTELEILYSALASSYGLEVAVEPDLKTARDRFAKARAGIPELEILQLRGSPHNPKHLWITKGPSDPIPTCEEIPSDA